MNTPQSMFVLENTEDISADKTPGVKPTALKVTFSEIISQSKSGDEGHILMEQVWEPGKPWWSTARLYEGKKVVEYTLAK
jgi:hypothetical protein